MKTFFRILAVASAAFVLSGCALRVVDFTAISTKNVQMDVANKGNRVVGQDCVPVVVIPFGIPNMKTAIDRAIENAGSDYDALVDGVVYSLPQHFIVGRQCFRVEGTPINTKTKLAQKQ